MRPRKKKKMLRIEKVCRTNRAYRDFLAHIEKFPSSVVQIDTVEGRKGIDEPALFPVILTDNGSKFSNPSAIEFAPDGRRRTFLFCCDPGAAYQKGAIENNHSLMRRVIPKGCSFSDFSQAKIDLLMNHVNSYPRKKLNGKSAIQAFSFFMNMHFFLS